MLILMTALITLCDSDSGGDGNFDQQAHEERKTDIMINRAQKILCVILMLILITAICLQVSILSDCVPRADNEADKMFHHIRLQLSSLPFST